jgi:hypothetical protein
MGAHTMIDIETEHLLTLRETAKFEPSRPDFSTVWRWRLRGVRGVQLETTMRGGKRYTSVEALRRFHERVTAAADGTTAPPESPRHRKRSIEQADRRADEMGV